MLAAPFVQMMTMYDYGCEKHYGRKVVRHGAKLTEKGMADMKQKIAAAEARVREK